MNGPDLLSMLRCQRCGATICHADEEKLLAILRDHLSSFHGIEVADIVYRGERQPGETREEAERRDWK